MLGSFFGYFFGFQLPPDGWTLAFGLALVACAAIVVIGDAQYPYSARAWAALTCSTTPAAAPPPPATPAAEAADTRPLPAAQPDEVQGSEISQPPA